MPNEDREAGAAGGAREESQEEPIRIVQHDPAWPARFEEERAALAAAIGAWATGGVHHVGSTAVAGLDAKPVIDILVGVAGLRESRDCFEALDRLGYRYAPYRSEEMHWFCKPDPSRRTHHLHLVPTDSRRFREELLFRDLLRTRAEVAEAYCVFKRSLARRFEHDREDYTTAKAEFIRDALKAPRELRLREAQGPDVDAMAAVLVAAWRAGFPGIVPTALEPPVERAADRLRQRLGNRAIGCALTQAEGQVRGFCVFGPTRDPDAGEDVGEIHQLFVAPAVWRSGVGTGLIEHATARLRRQGARSVTVWTFAENARANGFYANHGFFPDGGERRRPSHGDALEIRARRPLDRAP